MSLVGRAALNHPNKSVRDDVDDRATVPELFDPLNARYGFTVDVAAAAHNTKCERFYDRTQNGLEQDWDGEIVWCNPPYSNLRPWLLKAWASDALTVMLLPANRVEQRWWQDLVEPYRDRGLGLTCQFLAGRHRFIPPGKAVTKGGDRPPFGLCLLTWDGHTPTDHEPQGAML